MADRGAKPKPAHLRLVEGTRRAGRHGSEESLRQKVEEALSSFGKLARPKHLKGKQLAAWKRYIEPASWLDASKEPAALAFVELWSEFLESPQKFVAARHGQLRAYMSELGLTDERNRGDDHGEQGDDDTFDA